MDLVAGKPVRGVSDKASFKPVSPNLKNGTSPVASLDTVLYKTRTTKALIRLRG